MEKPQLLAHVQKSLNFTLFDAKWVPRSARFVVLGSHPRGTGALQIYEISEGDVKLLKEVRIRWRSHFKELSYTIQSRIQLFRR